MTALQMKDFILDNVQPNPNMQTHQNTVETVHIRAVVHPANHVVMQEVIVTMIATVKADKFEVMSGNNCD